MGRLKKPQTVNCNAAKEHSTQSVAVAKSHSRQSAAPTPSTSFSSSTNMASTSNWQHDPQQNNQQFSASSPHGDFETTVPEKHRGPTLMTDIWNQPIEKRIVVRWNKYWQPVGDEASMLANFLGTIARNPRLCCLKYSDWRKVPKKDKERLLDIVKTKFIIRHSLEEKYILQSLGRKWSNFKRQLKEHHYDSHYGNVAYILRNKPDHVSQDQWSWLVSYWNSSIGKKRSETNRRNRELQTMVHTGGSKSFARYADEKAVDGVLPSRAIVYLDTHSERKIANAPMDEKSRQAVDMIREKLSQLPNGVEETNGSVAWEGDVYSQVLNVVIGPERNNQVRGVGRIPKPFKFLSHVQDKTYFEDDHDVCTEKMECLLKKMKDKFEEKLRENANAQAMMHNEIKMLKEVVFARRIFEDYNI